MQRKWGKKNPELIKSYSKKYRDKNPQAHTEEATKYRRSHSKCEWSSCNYPSAQVHHILSKHKYPEYIDGEIDDGNGWIGNNFICYCTFHHFAYHDLYSTTRNAKKHGRVLHMLLFRVEQWANDNKIPIEDLEIELAQIYTQKVIFKIKYD